MEDVIHKIASYIALTLELVSILLIAFGAVEMIYRLIKFKSREGKGLRRDAWSSLGRWLMLGLEVTLAADIVRTTIAPTWEQIGQLGAIAVIRTFLNYFLERDLESIKPSSLDKVA